MRLAIAAALVLALALGPAACGGDDEEATDPAQATSAATATGPATTAETGSGPRERDPCRLLDAATVRRVFGEPVEGRAEEGDDADVCGYRGGRGRGGRPVPSGIDVFVGVADFVEQARLLAERGADPVEPLPRVGDSAFTSGNDAGAIVGDAGILVSVQGLDPSGPAVEKLLADLLEDAVAAY